MKILFQWSLCLILSVFITPTTSATEDSTKQDQKLIQVLFENYMEKYNHYLSHQELKTTPDLYDGTIMLMSSRNPAAVLPSAEFYKQVQSFLDSLKAKGVARVSWETVDIKMLDTNLALVSNVAVRYLDNDDIYNKVGATYFVNKHNNEWRISAFAVHNHSSEKVQTSGK